MKIITPQTDMPVNSDRYKLKEVADIADLLDRYGIPFFHNEPLLVIENGKRAISYTDFFLPTYNGLAIDYIIESQSGIYRRKKNVYQDNQIPAVLLSRRDISRPDWQKKLYGALQDIYHRQSAGYAGKARRYR